MARPSEARCPLKTSTGWSKALAIAFWICVWEAAAIIIGEDLFLPSPMAVLMALLRSMSEPGFWGAVSSTLLRIMAGFLLSVAAALAAAVLAWRCQPLRMLIDPLVKIVRATPVASVTILLLVWISSRSLSIAISFLMVFPIIYTNVLSGIEETDRTLLEMASCYRMPAWKRIRYIYVPSAMPYFSSAVSIALGLAWKSGIAAEVIGLPDGSIGERVYEAKIYLATPELFAWTAVVIVLAFLFERFFLRLSSLAAGRIMR